MSHSHEASSATTQVEGGSRPTLSLFDSVCVIVGIIIGSGIYKTLPLIALMTSGLTAQWLDGPLGDLPAADDWMPVAVLAGAWLLGAAIALCGALCYAELASAYPHHGGDFDYLRRAFGERTGFFFVWCEFWIVRPANIGAVAFVFAEYLLRFLRAATGAPLGDPEAIVGFGSFGIPADRFAEIVVALSAVFGLTFTNLLGVRGGIRVQNALSVAKMIGLIAIVLVAFFVPARDGHAIVPFSAPQPGSTDFALAMVLIMFALGGWNDLAFVSAEVRDPGRNLLRALLLGLGAVTLIYVLIAVAMVYGLGFGGVIGSGEPAADLLASRVGTWGGSSIAALIAVSTLGAINGMLFAGGRIYYTLGVEHRAFRWVGVWNDRWGGPVRGLISQTVIVAALIVAFGLYADGFERLVNFSTLFFWGFFLLVGISLIVLRRRDPDRPRPYRVHGYPVVPILFCLSSLYVLYSSVRYAMSQGGWEWAWAALIVLVGDWIMQGEHRSTGEPSRRFGAAVARSFARLAIILLAIGALLPLAGSSLWIGELASHFPLQLGLVGVAAALLGRWSGARHLTLVAAAFAALGFFRVAEAERPSLGARTAAEATADEAARPLRIASLNVLVGNRNFAPVLDTIRSLDADVVVVVEVGREWGERLADLDSLYPFREILPRGDAFGFAILSKHPLATSPSAGPADGIPQLLGRITRAEGDVWYVGATHVLPPVSPAAAVLRDADLRSWCDELASVDAPAVLIGDFNDTPYSAPFRQRLADGRWHDSRIGFGIQPTWPASLGAFGIPIDHALLSNRVAAAARSTFPIPGSDHRGVLLDAVRVPVAATTESSESRSSLDAAAASEGAAEGATRGAVSSPSDSATDIAAAEEPAAHRAVGRDGMVASVQPAATAAGIALFDQGGNAVDAAIATALALAVCDGHNSGLGGGCLILIRTEQGALIAIDGRETAPAAADREMFVRADAARGEGAEPASRTGPLAAAVPGALAAYERALELAGSKSLAETLGPAIALARDGFEVDASLAAALRSEAPVLATFPGSAAVLLHPDGSPFAQGERLVQADLARTLQGIATEGSDWFYRGPFARTVDAWMREQGGLMTAADLAAYRPVDRTPIETTYRGYRIVGFPPPSSGGVHVAQMLGMLERFDLARLYREDRAAADHVVIEAMKSAFADRAYWLGDPDFADVPLGLLDPDYLAERSSRIDPTRSTPVLAHGTPPAVDGPFFERHTTHIAAADARGNWVAITATINTTFGSKVIVPGTGIVLNNEMDDFAVAPGVPNAFGLIGADANAVEPGKRPLSSMSPTIVLDGDRPRLAIGAAGGPKIITQVLWGLIGTIDRQLDPAEALAEPRLHHQWSPDRLAIERGYDPDLAAALERRGHRIEWSRSAGVSQAVAWDPAENVLIGVRDPRVPGEARGWNRPD